ncbi:vesicle-associated protein 1-2-like [Apium graveolens]|uniref:vesicle-associated protein 1-2-like n=1 Tax=Apium graveolens TaxID=4045 RepID=UPI003D79CAB3
MSTGELLNIEPRELKFAFELRKQISSSLTLLNKTDNHVAFKVKTTNPKKYCVRPNTGVVQPGSTCDVTVTMQAQKEAPPDMQCKDKFLLQSVVTSSEATAKDITPEMFSKEAGHVVEDCKLKVVYVSSSQPPSYVTEGSEEGSSPRASHLDFGSRNSSEGSQRSFPDSHDKSSEVQALMSKLNEEKTAAIQQGNKLRQELELLIRGSGNRSQGGVSVKFVAIVGLISVLVGYLMKRT